jgi:hypothetical protein
VAKIEMRVIPEPAEDTRFVLGREGHAGSMVIKHTHGATTFLCARCRSVLAKNVDPDRELVYEEDPKTGDFRPVYRVRDVVFRCKGCGAFNEVGERQGPRSV